MNDYFLTILNDIDPIIRSEKQEVIREHLIKISDHFVDVEISSLIESGKLLVEYSIAEKLEKYYFIDQDFSKKDLVFFNMNLDHKTIAHSLKHF